MGHTTVRITEATHATLRVLAHAERRPMQAILEEAVEALRRRRFLESVNEGYAALRNEPAAWESLVAERAAWDATLLDGLEVRETAPVKPPGPKKRSRR